jgi:hypothetical protein
VWLKEYVRRRTFQHPDPFDLEKFAEDVSGLRLDWYFEQYTNMTRELDYAVADLEQQRTGDGWTATVELHRNDEIVMPIDVRLTLADGSTQWVNIPLGIMQGHKPVPSDWIVAEPWLWTFPDYTLTVDVPAEVTSVEIDPAGRMPDMNRLNNRDRIPRRARFLQPPQPSWFAYGIGYRPLVQYADDFGFGAGLQLRGRYLFGQKQLQGMVKLWPEVLFSGGVDPSIPDRSVGPPGPIPPSESSWFDGIDYALTYTDDAELLGPRARFSLSADKHLGLLENTFAVEKPLGPPIAAFTGGPERHVSAQLVHQYNPTDRVFGADDTPGGQRFNPFRQEHMVSVKLDYRVIDGLDWLTVGAEVGSSLRGLNGFFGSEGSTRSANRFYVSAGKSVTLSRLEGLATIGFGLAPSQLAAYKRFNLGSAPLETLWRNDTFRSLSAAFANPVSDAHLAGVTSSGPVAYLTPGVESKSIANPSLSGTRMLAGRLSIRTSRFQGVRLLRPLRIGLFSGIGEVWTQGDFLAGFDADNLVADAGLSVDYDVSKLGILDRWTAQSDVLSNLQITARFPVWASDPDLIDRGQEEWAFRWLLGIEVGL